MSLISKEHLKFLLKNIKALLSRKADKSDIVQSNWEQNDESALDYVKGRTHWEEEVENIILPEMTIEGFELMEEPLYAVEDVFSIELELNKTYTVVWDGVKYDVEYKEFEEFNGFGCLGNENYIDMNGGGDIPFALIFANGSIFVATESSVTSHTISITTSETTVHKIDEKYLPKMASTPDWNQNDPDGEGYIKNRPFYENFDISKTLFDDSFELNENGYFQFEQRLGLEENVEYVIVINDIAYKATAYFDDTGVMNACYIEIDNNTDFCLYDTYCQSSGNIYWAYETISLKVYKADYELKKIDEKYLPDGIGVQSDWNETDESSKAFILNKPNIGKDFIILKDIETGYNYSVQIKNGTLVTEMVGDLEDFEYTAENGKYTITGWKETLYGEASTEMILPGGSNIQL